jgi:hypothetical protein
MIGGIISSVVETKDRYTITVNGSKYVYYNNDRQMLPHDIDLSDRASRKMKPLFKGLYVEFECMDSCSTIRCLSVDTKRSNVDEFVKDLIKFLCAISPESSHPCIKSLRSVKCGVGCILDVLLSSCVKNKKPAFVSEILGLYKRYYYRLNEIGILKNDISRSEGIDDDLLKYMTSRCIKKIVDTPGYSNERFRKNPYHYLYPAGSNLECSKLFRAVSVFAKAYGVDKRCHLNGAICNALYYSMSEGNTCCPRRALSENVKSKELLLGLMFSYEDISNELDSNELYCVYDANVMFRWMYEKEAYVAKHVIDHVLAYDSVETHLHLRVDDYMCRFELENSMTLNKKQRVAVTTVFTSRSGIALLTGLPGTGKTSVIKCIEYIASNECIPYEMASPTGKSASKMGKSAKTIHRLLESVYDGRVFEFMRNAKNPLAADLIILDEVSMLDIELFYDFIKSCRPACMIVLIGDNNQLPSVKCGDVLGSLIRSGCIPHVHLSKLYRQGAGSRIPFVAKKVKDGEYLSSSDLNNDSIKFIPCIDESAVKQHVLDFYRTNKSTCKSKILAPNNSVVGMLNDDIHFYEYGTSFPVFEFGEDVMCVCNEYGKGADGSVDIESTVLNGEFVTICSYSDDCDLVEIQKQDGLKSKLTVSSKSLKYGYCITIHKSQGDEYDNVLLVLYNTPSKMLNKKLLYTALTRAKTHITIIGTKKYLCQCIDCPLDRCDVLESLILHHFENNKRHA